MYQESDPRQMVTICHHGGEALGWRNVGDRCSSLIVWWWTLGPWGAHLLLAISFQKQNLFFTLSKTC